MTGKKLLEIMNSKGIGPKGPSIFKPLYGTEAVEQEWRRYVSLVEGILSEGFPLEASQTAGELRVFSAPGRTELGGNHTDHSRGEVLAAAIQMDAIAVVAPRKDRQVFIRTPGFPDVQVCLVDADGKPDLTPKPAEKGMTEALVRGIAAEFAARGVEPGGFSANGVSTVLHGSGLSSSAAIEMLIAKIFDSLYGGGKCSPLELAQISQKAENTFFGKPSGLMDQAASASGGVVAIDFANPAAPRITQIVFNPLDMGFALCVINTRGNHADLTPDYAAIPHEMNAVARYFGKSFLREIAISDVLSHAGAIRESLGDRALLRSIHFFNENRRAQDMADALYALQTAVTAGKQQYMTRYLDLVNESGDSSWELLQNIYSPSDPGKQELALALAVSREFFRERGIQAACRVHGGGFAGTIQAYVPVDTLDAYRERMEALFGQGALTVLRIRPFGAIELDFDKVAHG